MTRDTEGRSFAIDDWCCSPNARVHGNLDLVNAFSRRVFGQILPQSLDLSTERSTVTNGLADTYEFLLPYEPCRLLHNVSVSFPSLPSLPSYRL